MIRKRHRVLRDGAAALLLGCLLLALAACTDSGSPGERSVALKVPRGYHSVLRVERNGQVATFGPFVGYYFRPESPDDLSRLRLVCFNEQGFYSSDMPVNAMLFKGRARLAQLPGSRSDQPQPIGRITPVSFGESPESWLETRPQPQESFVHFHSLYDGRGARMDGYWIAHKGLASFTYDMGGRVGEDSPLYHRVEPGPDTLFSHLVEFDQGPGKQ